MKAAVWMYTAAMTVLMVVALLAMVRELTRG
jgi:hypothetical protein